MGAMSETSPKDKKAETVREVATKKAVGGAPLQRSTGRDSQASEGGGRFTERRWIPVNHDPKFEKSDEVNEDRDPCR
jgi:hypothetical protein